MGAYDMLVGDVGGTNVRFAIARRQGGRLQVDQYQKFEGDDFDSFGDALAFYLDATGRIPEHACFALAGPIEQGEVKLTNRTWHVSARDIARRFNIAHVNFINDFAGMARAVPELGRETFDPILEGDPVAGAPVLVAGPGTGFGVATLFGSDEAGWQVLNGEGGHMAFSPRDHDELELASVLLRRHGYVSNELVASGSGLNAVHEALCEIHGVSYEETSPEEMRRLADSGDAMFRSLIQIRANTVMSAAGDLVLANGALGGVVLAGGVSERITDFLRSPEARDRFVQRGPLSRYLRNCPVWLMRDAQAPLIGAAAFHEQEIAR